MTEPLGELLARRRDPRRVEALAQALAAWGRQAALAGLKLRLMEVCGTHTMSVHRYGLKALLPPELELISGPGCPVCVTPAPLLGQALALARLPGIIVASFGDMLRVPLGGDSLLRAGEEGARVELVVSPLQALELAAQNKQAQVVFLAVGFETTAPLSAVTLQMAAERDIRNFSILNGHRTMPQALRALFSGESEIGGLLCPGHVAAVSGAAYFDFMPQELHKPAVIAGFEPVDIMEAILCLARQALAGECRLENAYKRAVSAEADNPAWKALWQVFEPSDALWRGLGLIEGSGLKLREDFGGYDAVKRFELPDSAAKDNPDCRCGAVLCGKLAPENCPLFGEDCNPHNPAGACMVSSEGACGAAYRYSK